MFSCCLDCFRSAESQYKLGMKYKNVVMKFSSNANVEKQSWEVTKQYFKDLRNAIYYLERSAKRGHTSAQYEFSILATSAYQARAFVTSYEAEKYLEKAAYGGHKKAQEEFLNFLERRNESDINFIRESFNKRVWQDCNKND